MTSGQRGGVALIFVALLGAVLARPILTGDSDPSPAPARTETERAEEGPTEEPTPTETPDEAPPPQLSSAFPERCLTPAPLPPDPGEIAAISTRGTFVASPRGEVHARIRGADGPVGFSPSGDHLLTGAGLLFDSEGSEQGPLFGDAVLGWAWSPQSDCALAVAESGELLVAAPGGDPTLLLKPTVRNFAVSADRLAVSVDPGLIAIYNLRSGRLVGEPVPLEGGPVALLVGWRGNLLVYASGTENRLDLYAVEALRNRTRTEDLGVKVGPELVAPCGDRLIGVTPDGGLTDVDGGALGADPAYDYGRPGCSPDGTFIAVPRKPADAPDDRFQIVILEPDGTFIQTAGPGGRGAEGAAEWSRSGRELVFVKAAGRRSAEVWYAAGEGGGASGIRVAVAPGSLDWNVSPPSGLPAQ